MGPCGPRQSQRLGFLPLRTLDGSRLGEDLGGDETSGFCALHLAVGAEVSEGWCWVPGPVVVRPVYAPAL